MPNGDAPSVTDPDSEYRRGTVLGLTVAEVFILLLFLLMLAFLALAQEWQTEADRPVTEPEKELGRVKEKLNEAESTLDGVQRVVQKYDGSMPTPDEIVTLEADKDEPSRISEDRRQDETDRLPENVRKLPERVEHIIRKALEEAKQAADRAKRAKASENQAKQATKRIEREINVLREKGHNPPCWYERVPDGRGSKREKPYYTGPSHARNIWRFVPITTEVYIFCWLFLGPGVILGA